MRREPKPKKQKTQLERLFAAKRARDIDLMRLIIGKSQRDGSIQEDLREAVRGWVLIEEVASELEQKIERFFARDIP